jgi:hypothetical protein
MKKTASELLKEKLIELNPDGKAAKNFTQAGFESEAEKVRQTFIEEDTDKVNEDIQHRGSLSL